VAHKIEIHTEVFRVPKQTGFADPLKGRF
jgi:hypothetical protein